MNRGVYMNILITGGTGLVGTKLVESFLEEDYNVFVLTRGETNIENNRLKFINFNPDIPGDLSFCDMLPDNFDTIFNLAGASLQKPWTDAHKERIYHSRKNVTQLLINAIDQKMFTVKTLVNGSAMGYYPPSRTSHFVEDDVFHPHDFLSEVVNAWEGIAYKAKDFGVRVVTTRFGLILDKEKGALPLMALPYRFKAGGKIGDGEHWYSWIHIEDVINALLFVFANKDIDGPVNFTAPEPVRQKDFSAYLSSALGQPEFFTTPAFLIKTVLGDMSALVLDSQIILPKVLIENDFKFLYPTLDLALDDIYR